MIRQNQTLPDESDGRELSREEIFGIIRVRVLYELNIKRLLGKTFSFGLSSKTKAGQRNTRQLLRILVGCRARNVSPSEYLFTQFYFHSKKSSWKYPYLNFLGSPAGFTEFEKRKERLTALYKTQRGAKGFLESRQDESLPFKSRFYSGFISLYSLFELGGISEFDSDLKLFLVFLAFPECFSPYFLVTHSKFLGIYNLDDNLLDNDSKQILSALREKVDAAVCEVSGNRRRSKELVDGRRKAEADDFIAVSKVFGQKPQWRLIWELMI
jgi:hypothetical protein